MTFRESIIDSYKNLISAIPIIAGVLFLISIAKVLLKGDNSSLFTGNPLIDPLIGGVSGSLSFGIPITSYIVGGELLSEGISLLAVTAFILSWSTVGIAMLPLETKFFGFKFSVFRNGINFVFSIIIAILTVYTIDFIRIWL